MLLRSRPGRPGGPVRPTLLLVVLAVAARGVAAGLPARPDEVGYLLVAAGAHPDGPFPYGDLWVDRPPLLIAFFALAGALARPVGVDPVLAARLLALAPVALLVVCAVSAGRGIAGARGGWWAGTVAAALTATPLLGAPGVDGEVLAAPLVMASVALALRAVPLPVPAGGDPGASSRPLDAVHPWSQRRRLLALAGAGALGAGAVDVKQNFAGALVIVVVLLLARALRGEERWRRAAAQLAAVGVGALVVVAATAVWAQAWGTGVPGLLDALVGFRTRSAAVIAGQSTGAPLRRLALLGLASLGSGLAVVLLGGLWASLARRRPTALDVAVLVDVAYSSVSIAAGGSYWRHYLVQLVPVAVLAAARLSAAVRLRRAGRAALTLTAASSAVALGVSLLAAATPPPVGAGCTPTPASSATIARWLAGHREEGDGVALAYGGADVLAGTGLRPAYPYLWSLPVRVLDPDLRALTAAVTGPGAATWVVRTIPRRSWGLDGDGRLGDALARGYRPVLTVCGQHVLLRRDLVRRAHPSLAGR